MVHCTGEPSNAVRNHQYYHWWFFCKLRWNHYGYHRVIYQDGTFSELQPLPLGLKHWGNISDSTMANGCGGSNHETLHVAYVGGIDPKTNKYCDTRTKSQKETLLLTIKEWKKLFDVTEVIGHRDWPGVKKACPCFDARKEYENV